MRKQEGEQICIFDLMSSMESTKREIRFSLKCWKETNGERRPWKKEYWRKRLKEALDKFNKDFPGYKITPKA